MSQKPKYAIKTAVAEAAAVSKKKYDYLFICVSRDTFERDFADVLSVTNPNGLTESPSYKSAKRTGLKNLRGSQDPGRTTEGISAETTLVEGLASLIQTSSTLDKWADDDDRPQLMPTVQDHIKVVRAVTDGEDPQSFLTEILQTLREKGRRVRATANLDFISEAVASRPKKSAALYVLVVGGEMPHPEESDQEEDPIERQQRKPLPRPNPLLGQNRVKDIKPVRLRNSSINSRGGDHQSESDGETTKSLNSTTTSSTAMHFITRNHNSQAETQRSTRSMSQKMAVVPQKKQQPHLSIDDAS